MAEHTLGTRKSWPGFPICLPQMAPLYTREPPSARNSVRRTIVQLRRPSPQPTLTWKDPGALLPAVHRVASLAKRWLLGPHQGSVEPAHLASYLNEFVFRFNRRRSRSRGMVFYRVLELAVAHARYATRTLSPPDGPGPCDLRRRRCAGTRRAWNALQRIASVVRRRGDGFSLHERELFAPGRRTTAATRARRPHCPAPRRARSSPSSVRRRPNAFGNAPRVKGGGKLDHGGGGKPDHPAAGRSS